MRWQWRRAYWLDVKRELREKYGPNCMFCGKYLTFKASTIDHLVPRAKGGTNHISNLAIACLTCNRKKGAS